MLKFIVILMPLFLSLTAGCSKKEVPSMVPNSEQSTGSQHTLPTITKTGHLDANWYTKDPRDLNQELDEYLELAVKKCYVEADPNAIRALVVPHAGLYYSGFCAATAYQTLLSNKNLLSPNIKNNKINHVIILAPDHSGTTSGMILPAYNHYKTPLGSIAVNSNAIKTLQKSSLAKISAKEHDMEHALEMQLPWLQKTINEFTITPIIVGNITQEETLQIANELKSIISDKTLLVVTSDFTHHGAQYQYKIFDDHIGCYLRALDSAVIETVLKKDLPSFREIIERTQATVCGYRPLLILLSLLGDIRIGDIEGRLCSYYTSSHLVQARNGSHQINVPDLIGDLPDEKIQSSVSYASIVFSAQRVSELLPENKLTGFEKRSLTTMARESIDNELSREDREPQQLLWPITTPSLTSPHGVFVTLYDKNDQLRGCIGRITSLKPLYQTTQEMALAAALKDSRFKPLNKAELDTAKLRITILSQPEKAFALSNIVLGKHGLILNKYKEDGTLLTSAVFLPQIPLSMNWDLATTLSELSIKAGLPQDGWQECEIQLFEGYEIKEEL